MFGTAVSGTVDATYSANWLIDGRPNRPVRLTDTGIALTITGTATDVDFLAIGHHSLTAANTPAISGDISTTLTIPSYGANDVPVNAYKTINTVSGVDSLTLTVTSSASPVIIGEFCAGTSATLPGTLNRHTSFRRNTFRANRPMDRAWIPPYDKGMESDEWTGTLLLTSAQRTSLLAWEQSQKAGTRPSVVVINSAAMWGFVEVGNQVAVGQLWKIDIRFVELPRTRW